MTTCSMFPASDETQALCFYSNHNSGAILNVCKFCILKFEAHNKILQPITLSALLCSQLSVYLVLHFFPHFVFLQSYVYDNLGAGILSNAWDGYNSTLFAYGQTGSGKSYSMVGYGVNKGDDKLFIHLLSIRNKPLVLIVTYTFLHIKFDLKRQ